jgi:hypothetical protein
MKNPSSAVICILACLFLCGFQQGSLTVPRKAGDKSGQRAEAKVPQTSTPTPCQLSNSAGSVAGGTGDKSQNQKVEVTAFPVTLKTELVKDRIDYALLVCTVALSIIGGVGTWAAVRSLGQIRRQAYILVDHRTHLEQLAAAASSNAGAAKASADALINGERAWVVTRISWQDGPKELTTTNSNGETRTFLSVSLKYRNDGRTPAWITNQRIWCRLVEDAPPAIPNTAIPPSYSRLGPDPISVGRRWKLSTSLECEGKRASMGTAMVVYGVVSYRDIFGEHETWCGYQVCGPPESPRLERLAGFENYNKYT